MIELMRQVIYCVTAASLFGAVALSLVQEGALKQVMRIAVGLTLILSLAVPFQRTISFPNWKDWLTGETEKQQTDTMQLYRDTICKQVELETAQYIEQQAQQQGIASCTAQVSAQADEDGTVRIVGVTLDMDTADDTFCQMIAEQLGLDADAVKTGGIP